MCFYFLILGVEMQKLSKELREILKLVAEGLSNKEIGVRLNYSSRTIERRINTLFGLYKVKNRVQLSNEYLAERFI